MVLLMDQTLMLLKPHVLNVTKKHVRLIKLPAQLQLLREEPLVTVSRAVQPIVIPNNVVNIIAIMELGKIGAPVEFATTKLPVLAAALAHVPLEETAVRILLVAGG